MANLVPKCWFFWGQLNRLKLFSPSIKDLKSNSVLCRFLGCCNFGRFRPNIHEDKTMMSMMIGGLTGIFCSECWKHVINLSSSLNFTAELIARGTVLEPRGLLLSLKDALRVKFRSKIWKNKLGKSTVQSGEKSIRGTVIRGGNLFF